MARFLSLLLVPTLVLAGLVGGQTALAQKKADPAHSVQDDAGFFSQAAKDRANQTIQQIKTQFKKDFFIETLDTSPESVKDDTALFVKWAQGRAKNFELNGIYIVMTKKPTRLQPVVGQKTRELGYFTNVNRDELVKLMIGKLKEGKNDEALTEGTVFVLDTLRKNKSTAAAVPPDAVKQRPAANQAPANNAGEFNWRMWILIGLAVLLGVWLISALLRAFSGGGAGAGSPGMAGGGYGGGGGGGFFSSLLGGMFGAAAGMWLYSNMFGGHTPSAHGGDNYGGAGSSGAEPTDVGGDYSGDGGADYGNDAGGDAGGGDFGGGGDWGGGGGDFGGGGE